MNTPVGENEARAMVRLVADVTGLHADHVTAKRHLMDGLCRLIGADRWLWALTYLQPGGENTHLFFQYHGFTEEEFSLIAQAADHPDLAVLMVPFTEELTRTAAHLTRLRQEIDPADTFATTDVQRLFLQAGVRPLMLSARPLNDRCQSFVAIYREKHREEFTPRERQIAHILLTEVSWLHGLGWPQDMGAKVPSLTPRNRTVLNLLLDGHSRKEIAARLDISIHTVSGYVKEVYAAFGVQSHAELMRRFSPL